MKKGLYGGSFNPIRKGHLEIAETVLETGIVDIVEIIPCNQHNHGKELVDFSHRFEMCYKATVDNPKIRVMDYEDRWQIGGRTFDLVERIMFESGRNGYTNDTFSLIIGVDCAENIQTWHKWEELLKLIPIIVVGDDLDEFPEIVSNTFRHRFVEVPFMDRTRSTEVRRLIKDGLPTFEMLHPEVEKYIQDNNLYR